MPLFADIPYWTEAFFAAIRISFWFVLLFGFIAPLFLPYIRKLPLIEKLIYSWVGLGGVLIFSVFVLSTFQLYDFIGLCITLVLIPTIANLLRSDTSNFLEELQDWETRTVVNHLKIIEEEGRSFWIWLKDRFSFKQKWTWKESANAITVVGIAVMGGMIRMFPALQHAAPFSRGWFSHLDRIKNIRLQDYFSGYPEPGGMHSLVSVFSMLTQVSPELILHLLGGLSSFFLCIIIYWSTRDIIKNRYPLAPILGMAVYALAPMLLIPISLDQQIEASSLDLALCFAIPTLTIFVRNLRNRYKSPWFYVLSGFMATAMVDLFVAFIILLPLMFLGLASLPRRNYFQSFYRVAGYLFWMSFMILVPFFVGCYYFDVNLQTFLLSQLYSIQAYSYYPFLILPLDEFTTFYMMIAGGLSLFYFLGWGIRKGKIRDELIFLLVFLIVSLPYTSLIDISNVIWLDVDQLNGFYAIMIAILGSIVFAAFLEVIDMIFKISKKGIRTHSWVVLLAVMGYLIFMQGGIKVSLSNPYTVPDGFLKAYYQIMDDRLPYSYATVGPKVQGIMAKNRNYFMDYNFFLNEYGAIDSLYKQQLELPGGEEKLEDIPPASIFVFTEKAPYSSIQQGILYDSPSVMRNIDQWISHYKSMPGRRVDIYYSDSQTTVYEIVNRSNESKIEDVLYQIYPEEKQGNHLND